MMLQLVPRDTLPGDRPAVFAVIDDSGMTVGTVAQDEVARAIPRFAAWVPRGVVPQWRSYGHRSPTDALHALEAHLSRAK
jgi:hypothetical protein